MFEKTLKLQEKKQLKPNVIAFVFEPIPELKREAGQYLQWSLPHKNPDDRGIKRYFTISSSPTEDFIMLTTKFAEASSSFKKALKNLGPGDEITVSELEGDFILPKDAGKKLAFIAGGIGITPFRSMIKYLLDKNETRDIVLLFSNRTAQDIVFNELFDSAAKIGVKTIYINNDQDGYLGEEMIKAKVPDWQERIFYISGPEPMVEAYEQLLYKMGVSEKQTKRDYFPGYTETK